MEAPKILVVDDEVETCDLLKRYLTERVKT